MNNTATVILFLLLAGAFTVATVIAKYYYVQYKLLERREDARKLARRGKDMSELERDIESIFGEVDYENL